MKWLTNLFGGKNGAPADAIKLARSRGFTYEIVGEASYQANLKRIAGPKEQYQKKHFCDAILRCERDNPKDPNAVSVSIDGHLVGFIPRDDAEAFRRELMVLDSSLPPAAVEAKIVGGWRDDEGEGHFGVKLNLRRPLTRSQ